MQIHVVQAGQTIASIAKEYDIAPAWIIRYNGLTDPDRLAVGQSLLLLQPVESVVVAEGDSLYTLAARYGTTPMQLLRNNPNLQGSWRIYP